MARTRRFFSSPKAQRELGYAWRAPIAAFQDAIAWADAQGLLRARSKTA
jgi:hypothetical protein